MRTRPGFVGKRPRSGYRQVVITLLSGLVLSSIVFAMALRWENRTIELEFQQEAEDHISALSRGMEPNLLVLESIGAFYAASQQVERLEFREFVKPLLSHHPGIQALEWIPRIPASQRDAYKKAARSEGFPHFQITEQNAQGQMILAEQREEYFPVYFVEPYEGNQAALGFDLASNPARRSALEQARDSATMVATSRINLVQETGEMFGILVFLPVYKKASVINSVVSRRKHLEGFVLGVFRIRDIVKGAMIYLAPVGIDILVLDLSAPSNEQFLYFHPSRIRRNPIRKPDIEDIMQKIDLRHTQTLDVAGRQWLILCTPTPAFISARTTWQPWGLFSLLVACTAIAAIYFFTNIRRAAQLSKAYHDLQSETKERMLVAEALKESEERFREMAETIREVFWLFDWKEQKVIYVSPAFEEVWGRSRETVYGNYEEWGRSIYPDDIPYAQESFIKIAETGGGESREYRILRPDGEIRWVSDRGFAIGDDYGQVVRIAGIAEDITDRKLAEDELAKHRDRLEELVEERTRELKEAQEALVKRERLSVLGQLTATVSHELRNPLGVIRTSAYYLRHRDSESDEMTKKHLQRIEDQVGLCDSIVEDLLEYTRGRLAQKIETDINPWLAQVVDEILEAKDLSLTKELSPGLPWVVIDQDKMHRVIVNLIDNALKAIGEMERKKEKEAYTPHIFVRTKETAGEVIIEVEDNGIGMDEGTAQSAFEPLFTTRARGTGLGLANVQKIINEHRGSVSLESEPNQGTRVAVSMPIEKARAESDR